jgi:hypothetical protein
MIKTTPLGPTVSSIVYRTYPKSHLDIRGPDPSTGLKQNELDPEAEAFHPGQPILRGLR